jgi:hypothetical protein
MQNAIPAKISPPIKVTAPQHKALAEYRPLDQGGRHGR